NPSNLLRQSQTYLKPAQNPSNQQSQTYSKPAQRPLNPIKPLEKQKKRQLKSNLQYFLGADCETQNRPAACHRPDPPVFTEKDFQKIQKEYFSNL
uniref:Uncharacterized protein n=1 Tax=Cyprinus carpio TaxID=7962 RepID=A0A8C2KJ63_CYPCA